LEGILIVSRFLPAAAVLAAFVCTVPALAADLVVDEAATPTPAAAPTGFYATFFAGGSFASGDTSVTYNGAGYTIGSELEPGFIVGGAVGATVYENLRAELEFSFIQAGVKSIAGSDVPDGYEATSTGYNLLGNVWYDFVNDTSFTPYIGAGVGYGYTELATDDFDGAYEASGLLYQLGAGVKFDVADNIALDLGYRYRVLSDANTTFDGEEIGGGYEIKTDAINHIVQAGVTFSF
jgi:opacity protein-like surface antigen